MSKAQKEQKRNPQKLPFGGEERRRAIDEVVDEAVHGKKPPKKTK